jgi:hypothetical protein
VSNAVRVTPVQFTRVSTTTTAAATGRSAPGAAYAANVIAIADALATLPTMKPHPATNPHHGPSTSRP